MRRAVERTLCLIKPDGVQRRLIGRIVSRFEDKGLRIAGMKLLRMTAGQAARLYAVHRKKDYYGRLVRFVTASPVVALVLEGRRAAAVARKLMGATRGYEAEPGTIRGDFGGSETLNLVHGADGPGAARREIPIFFRERELCGAGAPDLAWIYGEHER